MKLFNSKKEITKEVYEKLFDYSNIFYYECTDKNVYTKSYNATFSFLGGSRLRLDFYTPSAIGIGTQIGPHTELVKLLKKTKYIVVNAIEGGDNLFEKHLNKLFSIPNMKITAHPFYKDPELLDCFPKVPIIIVAKEEYVETIRQKAKYHNFSVNLITGTLESYESMSPDSEKVKATWFELEKMINQYELENEKKLQLPDISL